MGYKNGFKEYECNRQVVGQTRRAVLRRPIAYDEVARVGLIGPTRAGVTLANMSTPILQEVSSGF